ncbi:hypothetical protein D3C72_1441530 [compost metagenome]
MCINGANIFAVLLSLDEAFHHFFTFAARKITRLRADDLNVGGGGYAVSKTFLTVEGNAGAHGAL